MSTDLAPKQPTLDQELDRSTLYQVVTTGDTSAMTPDQKLQYYKVMCEGAGLDPRTVPFQFIKTNQGERIYATKSATNQLGLRHKVSCEITKQEIMRDVLMISVKAKTPDDRFTDEIGAVTVGELKGDAFANALMKCATKAKRRAVLSHCGLGVMDESEAETMGGAQATYVPQFPVDEKGQQPQLRPNPAPQQAATAPQAAPAPQPTPAPQPAPAARKPPAKKKPEEATTVEVKPQPPTPAAAAPAPAPIPAAAPAPAPSHAPGGRPTRTQRVNACCAKAGTSLDNGFKFLGRSLMVQDLGKANPVKMEGCIRAMEAFVATEEARVSQALINNEIPAWIDETQWHAFTNKFMELLALKTGEVEQLAGKR